MEETLVLVKGDGVRRKLVGEIIGRLESKGLDIHALTLMQVSRELAEEHYAEHREKPFFEELVEFITSTPVVAMRIGGEGAIQYRTQPDGRDEPGERRPRHYPGRPCPEHAGQSGPRLGLPRERLPRARPVLRLGSVRARAPGPRLRLAPEGGPPWAGRLRVRDPAQRLSRGDARGPAGDGPRERSGQGSERRAAHGRGGPRGRHDRLPPEPARRGAGPRPGEERGRGAPHALARCAAARTRSTPGSPSPAGKSYRCATR